MAFSIAMSRRLPLVLLLLALSAHAAPESPAWTARARRLTGESGRVRSAEVAALRATPALADSLRAAFGTRDQFLAFDVVVALDLREMIPELMAYTARDRTGYAYHSLSALATGDDRPRIIALYRERVRERGLPPAAKMAVIDALARTAEEIPGEDLDRLLDDEVPEVRQSALGYLRNSILHHSRWEDLDRVVARVGDPGDVLRLQALSLLTEIPGRREVVRDAIRKAVEKCRNDPFADARRTCLRLEAAVKK